MHLCYKTQTVTSPQKYKEEIIMSKFEKVYEIQKQYRRDVHSYYDAIKGIKEVFSIMITDQYAEWLLFEYHFC